MFDAILTISTNFTHKMFDVIIEKITDKIHSSSKFTREQIAKSLSVYRDGNSDFVMFLNGISKSPAEDARELYECIMQQNIDEIQNISCRGTSITFNLNKKLFFKQVLSEIRAKDTQYGKFDAGHEETVVIDYSSPNIAKLFHVGHYRTTILGNFIKNLLRNANYNVVSLNYLGDWGKQFGLVLLGFKMFGSEEELEKDALMHLFNVYVRINKEVKSNSALDDEAKEIFRAMEESHDEKYLSQWRRFREMSIVNFERLYKELNIEFEVYSGESFFFEPAKEFAKTTDLAITDEDGSKFIDCGVYGKALIQKSDGTTLYLTRDICAAMDRVKTYNAKKLIYVVSDEQKLHFQQLFTCMEKLGLDSKMFEHVSFGRVNGMSTRGGTVHFIDDIIQTSSDAIKTRLLANKDIEDTDINTTAKVLAISTLLIADFSAKRIKGYEFNFDDRANCEKGSGAYLQYAHCRLVSIEEHNVISVVESAEEIDFTHIDVPEVHDLCYRLMWFERVLKLCTDDYEPSRIVLYLMDLAKAVNNLISVFRVLGESPEVAKARMLLFSASRIVIRNGLVLLGITPLNKM